jgi:hypothetical protein
MLNAASDASLPNGHVIAVDGTSDDLDEPVTQVTITPPDKTDAVGRTWSSAVLGYRSSTTSESGPTDPIAYLPASRIRCSRTAPSARSTAWAASTASTSLAYSSRCGGKLYTPLSEHVTGFLRCAGCMHSS